VTEASQLPSPHAHRNRPTEVASGGTGLLGAGLFGVAQKLVKRLSGRPDREHEMSRNRLIWGSGILTYVFLVAAGDGSAMSRPQLIASVYVVMALLLFGHLVIFPGISVGRRIVGMIADFATLSWGLHAGGEYIGVLWPFYLWVIFGNGFRFGVEYLYLATGFAVSGFAVVVFTTAYWAANRMLGFGLLAGMIGLPVYAATLIHKLSQAKLQAERASQAKSRFLASVSHELRTPLNAVIGLSDLLRSSKLDVGQQDMVSTIKISARSLLSLIDDILDLSRIEAGEMPARVVDFSLYEMLSEIRAMLSVQAQAKGIRLNVHVTPRTPAAVRGDRRQIEEVLINLASNAVKFTDRGGVVIAVDGYVDGYSGGTEDEIALRVEVTDSGIGVAPEAQGRIFESFTQADESISNRFGGTGLGLAISRQLVRLLGGEIGVHSELGVGSTFWFTVTLKRPAEARTPGTETRSQIIIVSGDGAAGEHLASLAAPLCPDRLVVRNPAIALQLLRTPHAAGVRQRVMVFDARHCEEDAETFAAAFAHRNAENVAMVLVCANAVADLPPMPMRAYFAACVAEENLESQFAAAIRIACLGETLRLPAEEQPAGARRGFRLLLVDDNRINQKVIAKTLEAGGHEVIVVGDGEQALDALETSRFDLVLMDINMPVLDGLETTKLYRAMTMGQSHLPIVGLTADATPEAAQHCAEAGMDACITKPIEAPRLLELIDQLVPETPQTAPASTGLVADLSKDPRFQGAGRPALDPQKLEELLALGGQEFVSDIASAFLTDGMQLLEELRSAAARGDTRRFRDKLHALRSSAANVGARAIDELCFDWRQITTAELLAHGEDHVRRVEIEFERVRDLLPGHGVELTQSGTAY
jgi:two-component system sensor histidine kinase RpfC